MLVAVVESTRSGHEHWWSLKWHLLLKRAFYKKITLNVSFFLPSMWKFFAPPTMLRARWGLGLCALIIVQINGMWMFCLLLWFKMWQQVRTETWCANNNTYRRANNKTYRRRPQCSARKSFTLFIVVLSASLTYLHLALALVTYSIAYNSPLPTKKAIDILIFWHSDILIFWYSDIQIFWYSEVDTLHCLGAAPFKVNLAKGIWRQLLNMQAWTKIWMVPAWTVIILVSTWPRSKIQPEWQWLDAREQSFGAGRFRCQAPPRSSPSSPRSPSPPPSCCCASAARSGRRVSRLRLGWTGCTPSCWSGSRWRRWRSSCSSGSPLTPAGSSLTFATNRSSSFEAPIAGRSVGGFFSYSPPWWRIFRWMIMMEKDLQTSMERIVEA